MSDEDPEELRPDQVAEIARTIRCPRCGSKAYMACVNSHGRIQHHHHAERMSAARGGPTSERRYEFGRRAHVGGARRSDLRAPL